MPIKWAFPLALSLSLLQLPAWAETPYYEIATDPERGLQFERGRSASFAAFDQIRQDSIDNPVGFDIVPTMPHNPYGHPGVAVLDYDRDGDLDIYVTNGPGEPNSLFSNQLTESGELTFRDIAVEAGVEAIDQDGTGVCYGDLDNDGLPDIYVLGRDEPNRLYRNLGGGQFEEILDSGLGGDDGDSSSCSMGDVDGDGLLDIFTANVWDQDTMEGCVAEAFAKNEPDYLYLNNGDFTFTDVSETSGIRDLGGFDPEFTGLDTVTWAVGMVDIDTDGDIDIVLGDDQCGFPEARFGGIDRGFVHVLINDGNAQFIDFPVIVNDQAASSWMGLSFGDLNCDGNLDIFATNFGDYGDEIISPLPYRLGDESTRWLLGNGDGTFTDPAVGSIATVFGWGTGIYDYDNDADLDIVFHGGIDLNLQALTDNPGVILDNQDCSATFEAKIDAFETNHIRRNVQGMAIGDFDQNGFFDVVSVSSYNVPEELPIILSPSDYLDENPPATYAELFDPIAGFVPWFDLGPDGLSWNGVEMLPGDVSVELNRGNGNRWVRVRMVGGKGIIADGQVNQDGIGAVLSFTPVRGKFFPRLGKTVMKPIMGGSSFSSQHSLEVGFGLGKAKRGRLDILWPSGVRNRVYGVKHGKLAVVPEIPCSYDGDWDNIFEYSDCVVSALDQYLANGTITARQKAQLWLSAKLAFLDFRH